MGVQQSEMKWRGVQMEGKRKSGGKEVVESGEWSGPIGPRELLQLSKVLGFFQPATVSSR